MLRKGNLHTAMHSLKLARACSYVFMGVPASAHLMLSVLFSLYLTDVVCLSSALL